MRQEAKYVQVAQELLDRIRHLPPGSRCPSLLQVVREYHIARATADRALKRLVEKGYVEQIPGSGTFVGERVTSHIAESSPVTP